MAWTVLSALTTTNPIPPYASTKVGVSSCEVATHSGWLSPCLHEALPLLLMM